MKQVARTRSYYFFDGISILEVKGGIKREGGVPTEPLRDR